MLVLLNSSDILSFTVLHRTLAIYQIISKDTFHLSMGFLPNKIWQCPWLPWSTLIYFLSRQVLRDFRRMPQTLEEITIKIPSIANKVRPRLARTFTLNIAEVTENHWSCSLVNLNFQRNYSKTFTIKQSSGDFWNHQNCAEARNEKMTFPLYRHSSSAIILSLIHIWRCRRRG